ncbi:HlyD family efflux transporter periplasmic adaptor subunit [Paenibacillus sp. P26]|nr:HlyD family efflux transporter periplasmic adaptor subunit [Paenibacillus sp. P26]
MYGACFTVRGRLSGCRNTLEQRCCFGCSGRAFWQRERCRAAPSSPVEDEELKPPLVQPVKETLTVYEVKRADIVKQITGVATFASDKMDYLYYGESGGRLLSINVKLGDKVKAGDVIASTETGDLEMKIKLQEIAIEKIKLSLKADIADKGADDVAVRTKVLDLQGAQLQLDSLKSQMNKAKLIAPADGIVTYIDPIKPGDEVTAYKRLVTISDPRHMKLVYTTAGPNDLAGVEINMKVDAKINGKTYTGKVVQTPMTAPPNDNKAVQDKYNKSLYIDVPGSPEG